MAPMMRTCPTLMVVAGVGLVARVARKSLMCCIVQSLHRPEPAFTVNLLEAHDLNRRGIVHRVHIEVNDADGVVAHAQATLSVHGAFSGWKAPAQVHHALNHDVGMATPIARFATSCIFSRREVDGTASEPMRSWEEAATRIDVVSSLSVRCMVQLHDSYTSQA
eukprot:CAMPEP_0183426758 /NCGR_PEP_ID=MMETSP0370-20130417/39883_1 /TAXON_ID=268820 /ORGANISM="Peridinium aciculiferum, Strain PAER-2" /LENGTH=163 /DNA_ID=CAMNT_0025611213 /DNA_START=261 /DNA_END=752 /DNA_ORIENTATION=+